MKKLNILNRLLKLGIVSVIRGETIDEAKNSTIACINGGIKGIEITFTLNEADKAISFLTDKYKKNKDIVIGAGTVLDETTARIAILSGAEFIVSPAFCKNTAKLCNLYQIPYLAGAMTITEIQTALSYGVDIIKLFPSNNFEPNFIKAIKAPLPQANIMPTGGINLKNIKEWFESGAVLVGVGGDLTAPSKNGDFEKITQNAKKYIVEYENFLNNKIR
ncbi:MAG: bifunctional 2-keto-4-hydroxyglutarate aldolase/2-keto-3-deoxy-6-phosphogluconate aldolase [Defluviitaleaceae bacterium]|nr:bifunctional 2-keto-4-hydroxyglutarate aldolase/2-keto-3-deoxy-6-phosphogluconate aldolase [Defluviitaleaceae bacterium]